ncbi:DUF3888 domain-containing protein [Alkalihalobacillus trypoxylicola]|uniref:DUF3888 domain-containing protein n=2 Tax=Alkalihalobacillus trypoxylicola TaxID=519424 RepID=A0A162F7E5_9BACI|nr:DUF3888 domain-containing protein [Alkalihalobacillus trypoxylicola]KYG34964.1 hypothetical protein AZF04_01120 [Alkalihalobacillus trypoxylicola]
MIIQLKGGLSMKYRIVLCVFILLIFFPGNTGLTYTIDTNRESNDLIIHDALMSLLEAPIAKAVGEFYSQSLTEQPEVYPYDIDIIQLKRVNGFRSFLFEITVEVMPVLGPHIQVGKDRLTLELPSSPTTPIKVVKYNHLETYELPPNWKNVLKR